MPSRTSATGGAAGCGLLVDRPLIGPSRYLNEFLAVFGPVDGHVSARSPYRPASPDPLGGHAQCSRADVSEVDFLIDGKSLWLEHHAPYFYGDGGHSRRAQRHRALRRPDTGGWSSARSAGRSTRPQGLTMHLAGGHACPGFNDFMASVWTAMR